MMIYAIKDGAATQPLVKCTARSVEEHRLCVGYGPCGNDPGEQWCWFCFDQGGKITDLCFRPFILVGGDR